MKKENFKYQNYIGFLVEVTVNQGYVYKGNLSSYDYDDLIDIEIETSEKVKIPITCITGFKVIKQEWFLLMDDTFDWGKEAPPKTKEIIEADKKFREYIEECERKFRENKANYNTELSVLNISKKGINTFFIVRGEKLIWIK